MYHRSQPTYLPFSYSHIKFMNHNIFLAFFLKVTKIFLAFSYLCKFRMIEKSTYNINWEVIHFKFLWSRYINIYSEPINKFCSNTLGTNKIRVNCMFSHLIMMLVTLWSSNCFNFSNFMMQVKLCFSSIMTRNLI